MVLRYLQNVSTLRLDEEACTGCRICTFVCPASVLEMKGRKIHLARKDSCIECGACVINCVFNALSVRSGAGCASGILNSMLGRKNACCVIDD